MFDRRTIIGLVLVGIIFLMLPTYWRMVGPKTPPVSESTTPTATAPADTTQRAATPDTGRTALAKPETVARDSGAVVSEADTVTVQADYVTIETPLYHLTVGSNGRVSGYSLKKYHLAGGAPVLLTGLEPGRIIGTPDFDFGGYNLHSLEKTRFTASKTQVNLQSGEDSVVFTRQAANGEQIVLTYAVKADKYGFELALRTEGLKVPDNGEFQIRWLGGVPHTEPDPTRDLQYAGAYARVGDDVEKIAVTSAPRKDFTATGQTFFTAVRSKYFMAAIIPATPAAGADLVGINPAPKSKTTSHYYDLTLRQAWKGNATGRWSIYWGPIKHNNLEAYNVGLEGIMNWGWAIIRPISKAVLWALEALGRVIPNYGLVIIIFSVLVKVILWPLTRKSQVSMKKMASLQPEIAQIRELHAKNPQAMNAAIMKLYKDRGVNPASGCLPILLQMPVLYSLFIIFSTTIEFRQAPFALWITDLSMPDWIVKLGFSIPLYGAHIAVLPLVMGVTQFFMSKKTVTDPNQKMMLYVMPVFMLMIFNNLPSGLTLYYTLFNILAIVEQNLIKVPDFTPSVQVMDEPKKKR